jgi:hypothetical protein
MPFVDVESVHDMVALDEELDTNNLNSSNQHAFMLAGYFQTKLAESFLSFTRHVMQNANNEW